MKIETAAKLYILLLALTNCSSILGLISINESLLYPPLHLNYWMWNAILLLAYVVLPVTAVAKDSYISYVAFAGISVLRILMEYLGLLLYAAGLFFVFAPLYGFSALLCLFLAAEKVASKISAEILSLVWSQH